MLKISTKARYSVRAVFDMAYHNAGEPSRVREISERQGISARYLEQIFQSLRRGGILKSRRGPHGGYYLSRSLSEIKVADVIRAAEGSLVRSFKAGRRKKMELPITEVYLSKEVWQEVERVVEERLEEIDLETLCEKGRQAGLPSELEKKVMYFI
ncbi:MAG: Rrf2 family transcriptional regulator [Deltaproteobacteria bacterium]|nr:Rrf2 family transcriptional regulator [Deltaproteobacteria bacterium]